VNGKDVVDVPEDVDTVLDSLEAAAMFEIEINKGPLVFFTNTVYYKGDYDEAFNGPVTGLSRSFNLEEKVWAIKYGAGYELGTWHLGKSDDSPTFKFIPWAGAFYFHDDYTLRVDPVNAPGGGQVEGTFEFNTPMVGLAVRTKFSEHWVLGLNYGYGGWNIDEVDEVYDFIGNVSYLFTMWNVPSRFFVGYRYLHFEHTDGVNNINIDVKGPLIGIGWEF
jgi:hypothetical protein